MRTQSCPLLAVLDHREPRWHSLRDVHGDVRAAHARFAGAMRNVHRDRNGLPRIPSQDALRHPSAATHRAGFPCAAAQHRSPGGPISPELKPDISRGGYVRRSGMTRPVPPYQRVELTASLEAASRHKTDVDQLETP